MQFVIPIDFAEAALPAAEAIGSAVTALTKAHVRFDATRPRAHGWGMTLTRVATGEHVALSVATARARVSVEVEPEPTAFQWAVAAALVTLGGRSALWAIPEAAFEPLDARTDRGA
jgi:hypothetical protein